MSKKDTRQRVKLGLTVLVVFVAIMFGVITVQGSVHAVDYSRVLSKWIYTNYYSCLDSSIYSAETITSMPESNIVLDDVFNTVGEKWLPSYGLAGGSATSLNCREIVKGKSGMNGLYANGVLGSYKNIMWKNKTASENLMTNVLKYEPIQGASGESSFRITATTSTRHQYYSGWLWGNEDYTTEGEAATVTIQAKPSTNGKIQYTIDDGFANFFSDLKVKITSDTLTIYLNDLGLLAGCSADDFSKSFLLTDDPQDLFNEIASTLDNTSAKMTCTQSSSAGAFTSTNTTTTTYTFSTSNDGGGIIDSTSVTGYKKRTGAASSAKMSLYAVSPYITTINNPGVSSDKSVIFDTTDYYNLYTYYVQHAVAGSGSTVNTVTCDPTSTNNLTKVQFIDNDGKPNKNCYVNFNGVDPSSITVYTQMEGPALTTITMQGVIDWLNSADLGAVDPNAVENVGGIANGGSTGGQPEDPNSGTSACYTAAASLGWFLCPVLEGASDALTGIYDMVIKPFLQVKSSFFDRSGSGVYEGWKQFRNFANILFAIAFAVVIFAQVTGVGISNYNIKKLLPRLIMVVVLVNLSFVICQLAVDISNIAGAGLQKMFGDMANSISVPTGANGQALYTAQDGAPWSSLSSIVSTAVSGLFVAGAVVALVINWGVWLIPFLLTILSAVISVLFFFVILGVRQAGVLILTALAPVAIVCYALPNTKSFYDKWFKLFSALLLVYPICGLLIGGGQYASALLISTGEQNFFFDIVAMLISVVPFFFIPSILKGSMIAAGNIGAKIAAMGSRSGSLATGAIRGTRSYQEHQAEAVRQRDLARNNRIVKKLDKRLQGRGIMGRATTAIAASHIPLLSRAATSSQQAAMIRQNRAQMGINRSISEASAATQAAMENDGTSGDFGKMGDMLAADMVQLQKNPTDANVLAHADALIQTMSTTEPGQNMLSSVLNKAALDTKGLSGKQRANANKALRRMGNTMMKANGNGIKQDAPELNALMKSFMAATDSSDLHNGVFQTTDGSGNTIYANKQHLLSGAASLSKQGVAKANPSFFENLTNAINSGDMQLSSEDDMVAVQNAIAASRGALTDSIVSKDIKGKDATQVQRMANFPYLQASGNRQAVTDMIAKADTTELSRIQDGIVKNTIADDPNNNSLDRTNMLSSLEQTMVRATTDSGFTLTPEQATIIDKTLRDSGINVVDNMRNRVYDGTGSVPTGFSVDQFARQYEALMGMKVDHSGAAQGGTTTGQKIVIARANDRIDTSGFGESTADAARRQHNASQANRTLHGK